MHLSKKAEYTLRAMIHLGMAVEVGRTTISSSELAEANRLPLRFIERIFLELREAGFVETHRGKFGGYSLAKPANEIVIGDLIRLTDDRLAPICCASSHAYQSCTCPDENHCGLRMIMIDVRNAVSDILDRFTIAQVVEVTLRKMRRDGITPPFSKAPEFETKTSPSKHPIHPTDGFLAGLTQLQQPTPDLHVDYHL